MASEDSELGPEPDFYDLVDRCMRKKGSALPSPRELFATPAKGLKTVAMIARALSDQAEGALTDTAAEQQLGKGFAAQVGLGAKTAYEQQDAIVYLGRLFDCLVDHGTPYDKLPPINSLKTYIRAAPEPVMEAAPPTEMREPPPPTINPPDRTPPPTINPPDSPKVPIEAKATVVGNSILAAVFGLLLAIVIIAAVFKIASSSSPTPAPASQTGSYNLDWSCGNQSQCAQDHAGQYSGVAVQGVSYDECIAAQGRFGMTRAAAPGDPGSWCAPG